MKQNQHNERESITGRVIEFLRTYPPFKALEIDTLRELANHTSISYKDKGQSIFLSGDKLHDSIYVVRKGEVRIVSSSNELVDICTEGQVFGARAFMASETYQAAAIADPEALIIKIPVEAMRSIIASNPMVMEFFFGDFSSGVALRKRKLRDINEHFISQSSNPNFQAADPSYFLSDLKTPITCTTETSIKDAALIMQSKDVGSIVIVSNENHPLGIVTDTDLRNKVVTGNHNIESKISEIMTHPVKTVSHGQSSEEYLLKMIELGVHHLCITQSGSAIEPILGVISDHDLLVSRGNNAAILIKELRKTKDPQKRQVVISRFDKHIKSLVSNNHPISNIGTIVQSFNRTLLNQVINEELNEIPGLSKDDFCWIALGSVARGEQIIRTDFDSAIILKNEATCSPDDLKKLADKVFKTLFALGFENDKAGIQANNLDWIMTLNQWKGKFRSWISEPTERALLNATIFFDLMPFYGDEKLANELQEFISTTYQGNRQFIAFLAQNALQNPPPLGFFKNLLLEKSGENKDSFDIKARAMMPLADAARLKALEHNCMYPSNTTSRYQRLSQTASNNNSKYEDCAVAYEIFMRVRANEGLQHGNDGRYIDPSHLSHLEKQVLKKAFEPIASIQHIVKPV